MSSHRDALAGTSLARRAAIREYIADHRQSVDGGPRPEHRHGELSDSLLSAGAPRREKGSGRWLDPAKDAAGTLLMLKSSWLNVLLLAAPLGLAAEHLGWGASAVFLLNLCALIPLALMLGFVTEDLSLRLGELLGGLINATFGNVVEIILSISALLKGLYTVVATSLLGSILSNMLFVLGMAFVAGGLKHKIVCFNANAAQASISLLLLSAISITLPTAALHLSFSGADEEHLSPDDVLLMSRLTAVALLAVYGLYLYFQLGSHSDLFGAPDGVDVASCDSDEADDPVLTLGAASLWLGTITVLVAACSEALTGSIEEVSHSWGLSTGFIGFIILPIAGNACEHITAVFVAMKNKMDLSMGIAIGSSIQIGLLAIPLATLVGWATGHPFSLAFDPFSALVLVLSVVHTTVMIQDAESNWLEGVQLMVTYFIVAVAYAMT